MRIVSLSIGACAMLLLPAITEAAAITLQHDHFLFTITDRDQINLRQEQEQWMLHGTPIAPPTALRVDGDEDRPLPAGIEKTTTTVWSLPAIESLLRSKLAEFEREPGTVAIDKNGSGVIVFDGVGLPGRTVDYTKAALLVREALETGITDITLPLTITDPTVVVRSPELVERGIKEFVTVGESDFAGSSRDRRHNINVGLNTFNGFVIPQGETFSFAGNMGPIDASTGYRRELVIKGDRTEPDYGGGLCQVSTTAYRGVWTYGFPIVARKNHSYTVSYYQPVGTDATVYSGWPDMQFLNDSPGDLVMQTYMDDENDKAYFIYYGTKDNRDAELVGPYIWGYTSAPPARTEFTTDLPPEYRQVVGKAVAGMKAAWFRVIDKDGEQTIEEVYSTYEARPYFTLIGVEEMPVEENSELAEQTEVIIP